MFLAPNYQARFARVVHYKCGECKWDYTIPWINHQIHYEMHRMDDLTNRP